MTAEAGKGGAAAAPSLLVIVQARLSSSRLPGKVLLEAAGKTLLGHLLDRLARSAYEPKVVLATSVAAGDDRLAAEAARFGVSSFRGSEADVLDRFRGALAEHPAQVVVRITADNPLLDPKELDRVVGEFLSHWNGPHAVDYATNHTEDPSLPLGLDVEVFGADALQRAAEEATDSGDREHVTAYLYRVPGRFRVLRTRYPRPDLARLRLTVDTPQDFELVRSVLEALGPDAEIDEIARFLDEHPEVAGLNAAVVQRTLESEADLRRRRVAGRYLVGRADASASIGYGHAVRLGALLEAWTELGGRALLIGRGMKGCLASRLLGCGIELAEPASEGGAGEVAAVLERAHALSASALAIDGYTFDSAYHEALCTSLPLLAIDDLAAERPIADVILNQNLDFDRTRYGTLRPGQRLLTGAPYVLLRRGLRDLIERRAGRALDSKGVARIAFCFGGSDPLELTETMAAELLETVPFAELTAIVGPGVDAQRKAALLARAEISPRLNVQVDPPEIGALLADSDVLITAAGVTVWEALSLGVPAILVTIAENQRVVADSVFARGAGLDAGRASAASARRAAELALGLLQAAELRARLSATGRQLIDGRGVWRAVDALLDAIDERTV